MIATPGGAWALVEVKRKWSFEKKEGGISRYHLTYALIMQQGCVKRGFELR